MTDTVRTKADLLLLYADNSAEGISEQDLRDGVVSWMPDYPDWQGVNETWAFASSTTITVPTGAAARYQKGDKVWLNQSGSKYFYIVGVADTVLTVTGGIDYTVANAAISAIYISRVASPFGFPPYFNFTPSWTGFSANPTVDYARFTVQGNVCQIFYHQTAAGTSNATGFIMGSLPITTLGGGLYAGLLTPIGQDNAANITIPQIDVQGVSIIFYKTIGTSASWTASSTKGVYGLAVSYQF